MSLRRRELLSAGAGFLVAAVALAIGAYFWGIGVEDRIVERMGIEDGRVVVGADPPRDRRAVGSTPSEFPTSPNLGNDQGDAPNGSGTVDQPDPAKGGSDDAPAPGDGGDNEGPAAVIPSAPTPVSSAPVDQPPAPEPSPPPAQPDPLSRQPIREAVGPVVEGVVEGGCALAPKLCPLLPKGSVEQ